MDRKNNPTPRLRITLQAISDGLEELGSKNRILGDHGQEDLVGFQLFEPSVTWREDTLCLCTADQLTEALRKEARRIVVVGVGMPAFPPVNAAILIMEEPSSLLGAANGIQKIFSRYFTLERRVNSILYGEGTPEDLGSLLLDSMGNPLFIHDEHYNILACPKWVEGMNTFTFNHQTGKFMQDMETINFFKASDEYKQTLQTHGGQWWLSGLMDFKTAYANLWVNDSYKGRIVVHEIYQTIRKSHLDMLGYFAELAALMLMRSNSGRQEGIHPMNSLLRAMLIGVRPEWEDLKKGMTRSGWNLNDSYLCGLFIFNREEASRMWVYGICNGIEHVVPGSHAFYQDDQIYMIVNLTAGALGEYDLRKRLGTIIRESLLHVGVSHTFHNLLHAAVFFKQAAIALECGQNAEPTKWYYAFKDWAIPYWLDHGTQTLGPVGLVSPALQMLKEYDAQHHSSLYLTLKIYLENERNGTLTAQLLNIHRSTLPHRLERIQELTGADLDQSSNRLYLLMSYHLLEESQ